MNMPNHDNALRNGSAAKQLPKQSKKVVPCFTPGTAIATPRGEVLVEDLKVGARVLTRDNGIQHISWVGHKDATAEDLTITQTIRPIFIKAGALGRGLPERDMQVSPFHRMLIVSELAQMYFEQNEVLVYAKDLLKLKGVGVAPIQNVKYIHFMCEHHEIVLSNGSWTETFQPGDHSLQGVDGPQREELFRLFPQLATMEGRKNYRAARKTLQKKETKLLVTEMSAN
ncbi:type I secretion protein [Loktanella sp. D2R18]|uniref:Hint domain-containing protein n=1 Tax=Rhodobacterales TaxID=204455 RepID=UPI000DE90D40|nr:MULTISPECIES: Hint domain-containing protein [Rhodobacterales]MDO6589464.1 Hint domain-containing protein [Yoonia sp. 1_MG-2023]RBW44114.1 type I secretion protein [Loktanella sp. D2R18]